MSVIRIILFPVSLLYGIVTYVRNKLFDWKVLRQASFPLPIVSVGNLSSGGTGKTPHVEYLVRLLESKFRVAILSRGYKRKTRGYVRAGESSTVETIGDEAFQYQKRFPSVMVAVDEKRTHGAGRLLKEGNPPEVILLDDAFQHRWIKPGLSILLTDFYHLYSNDYLLPTGNLREFRSGADRADIIVVTKTPRVLNPITRQRVRDELNPTPNQTLYFSYIEHGPLTQIPGVEFIPGDNYNDHTALLFAGIANPYPLEFYLKKFFSEVEHAYFPDHHMYSVRDLERVIRKFDKIFTKNKVLVTTEKDMVRLIQPDILGLIRHLPICYVSMKVRFHQEDKHAFEKQITDYVKNH